MRTGNPWSCNVPYLNIRKRLDRLFSLEQLVLDSSLVRTNTFNHERLVFRFEALKSKLDNQDDVQGLH